LPLTLRRREWRRGSRAARRRGVAGRARTGACGAHNPGCFRYTTATMQGLSGDGRARTGGLSPDKRALSAAELRPRRCSSAGGIRTHGLELMRLARTAAPLLRIENSAAKRLPRRSRGRDPLLRISRPSAEIWPAGVEPAVSGTRNRRDGLLPYSQMQHRRPWNRTTPIRFIRAAPAQPARRRRGGIRSADRACEESQASPGNRTLLHGFTARGLATSLATQSRREESNLRGPG
jgi:hypothetical protein